MKPNNTTLALLFFLTTLYANAAEDMEALTATCATCHGAKGVSENPAWPSLAGQKAGYLISQMRAFRDGERQDPLMSPMAKGLTDSQINQLATYYAEQQPTMARAEAVNEEGKNVRAHCISCHGMKGITVNPQWPNLAGQKKAYLQKQLLAFRSGERDNPVMQVIAKGLSDEQIEAVAEYYSQLPGR